MVVKHSIKSNQNGWHKLSTQRLIHRLKWFYKIINNIAPQYLTDIVPPTVGERQRYNLRTHGNISQISAQKQCYIKSFFPSTIKEWNMLPMDFRNSRSRNVFERRLKLHFPSPIKMPWFSVGERFVNIHHTRIRIGCSKLKHIYILISMWKMIHHTDVDLGLKTHITSYSHAPCMLR